MTKKQAMNLQKLIKNVRNFLSFEENRKDFEKKLESCKINGVYHTCTAENTKKPKPL